MVNLYESGQAKLTFRNGTPVEIDTDTRYPGEDQIRITVSPAAKKSFTVKLRIPSWCRTASIEVNGKSLETKSGSEGYVKIERSWKPGDKIELTLKQEPRLIVGDHKNQDKVAILYGLLVLATDEALLKADGQTLTSFAIAEPGVAVLALTPERAPADAQTWPRARVFRLNAVGRKDGSPVSVHLNSFADAGGTGSAYKVWLPLTAYVEPDAVVAPVANTPAAAPVPTSTDASLGVGSIIRIDAGAVTNYMDSAGNLWLSDRGFEGGELFVPEDEMKIENTKDVSLYRTEHWGMSSFSQRLANGRYLVKLYFAETFDGIEGPGGRVFSLIIPAS